MNNTRKIAGFILLIAGAVMVLDNYGLTILSINEILGYGLIMYGVPAVYVSMNNGKRNILFFGSALFMIGIMLVVLSNYEIINSRGTIFSSILFINGTSLFLLFLENSKQKIFLYASMALLLLGYLSITVLKKIGILILSNKVADYAEDFWPIILILTGLLVFLRRKSNLSS